jgi:hypothetical protein
MTTSTTEISDQQVQSYLGRLDEALAGSSAEEREDILLEIRAHILDSAAASPDRTGAIDRTLRLLGTPEELAGRYSAERMLTRASRSFSPWLLLRTCWRWAKLGIKGTLAFLLALFGYTIALAFTVALLLKPIMPSKVGLWVGREGLNLIPMHTDGMHELLGQWFIPVIALTAFATALGTTQGLRWMMRRRTAPSAHQLPA